MVPGDTCEGELRWQGTEEMGGVRDLKRITVGARASRGENEVEGNSVERR